MNQKLILKEKLVPNFHLKLNFKMLVLIVIRHLNLNTTVYQAETPKKYL
jgi:hypothetical protein